MCIVCKQSKEKNKLIRVVDTDTGVMLDFTGKVPGRGAYICDNMDCIDKCQKAKSLHKAFKKNIDVDSYNRVREQYIGRK